MNGEFTQETFSIYAKGVFDTLDKNNDGKISFYEFVHGLSALTSTGKKILNFINYNQSTLFCLKLVFLRKYYFIQVRYFYYSCNRGSLCLFD